MARQSLSFLEALRMQVTIWFFHIVPVLSLAVDWPFGRGCVQSVHLFARHTVGFLHYNRRFLLAQFLSQTE